MQARFQNPNPQWFIVRASKDMVQEYLCSSVVAGSSCLPLFLTKKRIFVLVMISCYFHCPCFLYYKITDKHSKFEDEAFCLENNADPGCEFRLLYDHFTEPNKIEELEVVVEIDSLEEGVEDNLSIETCCIVHEEEGDEVYFLPINPKKVIKFNSESLCSMETVVVTITHTVSSPQP